MTQPIRAELLLNISNWDKNLQRSAKQLEGFGKSMKVISTTVKALWAGVAVGAIGSVYDAIVDVTKAASDDTRSQALLAEQMKRTWKGNDTLNKSIEDQIDKMSNATGVIDDKLRPALIRIAGVTKSPVKGMKALKLSVDIAAKSGKDLNAVSQAMAKFLGGNKTALDKMVPGLKESGDRMKFLKENYSGFAEISGRNDPFGRINVVIENFKEKLGKAFLPIANNIADWLAGDEAQSALNGIAKWVQDTFAWFTSPEASAMFADWYDKAKDLFDIVVGMVKGLEEFLSKMPGAKPKGQTKFENYQEEERKKLEEKTKKYGAPEAKRTSENQTGFTKQGQQFNYKAFGDFKTFSPGQINAVEVPKNGDITNIYINGMINANEVVTELGKLARKKGVPLSKLLA
jgi:hypothetical protein